MVTPPIVSLAMELHNAGTTDDRLYAMLMLGSPRKMTKQQLKEAKRHSMRYRSADEIEKVTLMEAAIRLTEQRSADSR